MTNEQPTQEIGAVNISHIPFETDAGNCPACGYRPNRSGH